MAASLFVGGVVFAVVHRLIGAEYDTFAHWHNVAVDILLAVVWSASAAALLAAPRSPNALSIAALGTLLAMFHGVMFSVSARAPVGVPFIVAAPIIFLVLAHEKPAAERAYGFHPGRWQSV